MWNPHFSPEDPFHLSALDTELRLLFSFFMWVGWRCPFCWGWRVSLISLCWIVPFLTLRVGVLMLTFRMWHVWLKMLFKGRTELKWNLSHGPYPICIGSSQEEEIRARQVEQPRNQPPERVAMSSGIASATQPIQHQPGNVIGHYLKFKTSNTFF